MAKVTSGPFNITIVASGELLLDGVATPEQIAVYIPATGFSPTATATCRYKVKDAQDWITGHDLFRVQNGTDVFAWTIIDLLPNTTYEVEATVTDGIPTVYNLEQKTRQLPPTAGSPTVQRGAGTLTQTDIDNLTNGSVLELGVGTHNIGSLTFGITASANNPCYIRGADKDTTIVQDSGGGTIFDLRNISNVIFENMTISGSGVDGVPPSSKVFQQGNLYSSTNVTVRNIACTGVDRFWDTYDCTGVLIYNNTITGNNLWTFDFNENDDQRGWGDYGIIFPGNGNCAWQNTMTGFGDLFSPARSSGSYTGTNIHFYRNLCRNTCDDLLEADDATRNITFYDNHSTNSANLDSVDGLSGGPLIIARNVLINPYRPKPHKWNSNANGVFLYNNTVVSTVTKSGPSSSNEDIALWYQPSATVDYVGVRNNLHVYGGNGTTIRMDGVSGLNTIDWSNNAWYPDREWQVEGLGITANTLALAKLDASAITPIFSGKDALEDDVIVTSQPFETAVVFPGADSATEVTIHYEPQLKATESAYQTGVEIPNIMDSTHGYTGLAPDMGALPNGVSVPNYGDQSIVPQYLTNANPFVVVALNGANSPGNNETMEDVTPAEWLNSTRDEGGFGDLVDTINAWSGGAATPDGRLLIHGGGHTDGAYNGIWEYDFMGESPGGFSLWPNSLSALDDAIDEFAGQNSYVNLDGWPTAIHSYDNLVFDETGGRMYRFRGSRYSQGGGGSRNFYHDGTAWSAFGFVPNGPTSGIVNGTVIDQASRKILWNRSSEAELHFFDIAGNSWGGSVTYSGAQINGDNPYTSLAKAGDRVFVFGDSYYRYIDINWTSETGTNGGYTPSTNTRHFSANGPAAVYDPDGGDGDGRLWILGGVDSSDFDYVTEFNPITFEATEHALTGANIELHATARPFFSRMVWIDDYKAIGLVTRVDRPAYIFKVR